MRPVLQCLVVASLVGLAAPALGGPLQEGMKLYDTFQYRSAKLILEPLALEGDPRAQLALGLMYLDGRGVPLSSLVAAKWFRLSAAQGNAEAQDNLALLYFRGRGVRPDPIEAARWFRRAALQGNSRAQQCLAGLYAIGQGVQRDLTMAYAWYSLAALRGTDEQSGIDRDDLALKMTPRQRSSAVRIADRLLVEASASSLPHADAALVPSASTPGE